jgi:hypothetical protein
MPKIALRPFVVILALLTGLSARAASAAEIKVVCSGASARCCSSSLRLSRNRRAISW